MDGGAGSAKNQEPSRKQLRWFLFGRLLVVTLFLGGTIFFQLRSGLGTFHPALPYLYLLIGLFYLQALLIAAVHWQLPRTARLIHTQIVWDLLFATCLIYLTGGIDSIFSFVYILSIISAGFLLGRRETLIVASASAILYGSLLDLQFYGYLPALEGLTLAHPADGREVFYAVFVHVVAFLLAGLLSGTVSDRLRKSEQALERRRIDFQELENLNRTILANIGSGLMIVNPQGRIRSFNAAASKITGFSLEEVYDRDVGSLFPSFRVFNGGFRVIPRAEGAFQDRQGKTLNLGYSSSLLRGGQGGTVGLLVTFQDLTHLKEMEERLQRANRLAAVGRLASGMAHEIRNPLASISGSVQLLMEGEHVREEDRRLMGIVVKEADRLSGLLTDFLLYARPSAPKLGEVDLPKLLGELVDMVRGDERFARVDICCELPAGLRLCVDREQFRQALWNLFINAAEAMPEGGTLRVGSEPDERILFVEDSGVGIAEEIRENIFEPFFTTKDSGTGLGLATVYAIVKAHGGEITLSRGLLGGARFVIRLPESFLGAEGMQPVVSSNR